MKRGIKVFATAMMMLCIGACSETMRSYTEMLDDQQEIIDRWIVEYGLEILEEYPEDGHFEDNQYVLLDNGLYLNVVDTGYGERPEVNRTNLLIRFNFEFESLGDTTSYTGNNFDTGTWPVDMIYGQSTVDNNTFNEFAGEGLVYPYQYVESLREGAEVKMIVPFSMALSSTSFQTSGLPVFHSKVRYTYY